MMSREPKKPQRPPSARKPGGSEIYSTSNGGSEKDYEWWSGSVNLLLEAAGLAEVLKWHGKVVLKPNLVEALNPPITTPVGLTEAVCRYIMEHAPGTEIVVADGTGSLDYDTFHCFDELGYSAMSKRIGVKLLDLNEEEPVRLTDPELKFWPEIFLPRIIIESYLISLPVLKAHTLAGVTLSMKNMIGTAPPSHYQEGGHWKKSAFHEHMDESIFDINLCRAPDFTVLDATVGMSEAHLWGAHCDPPPGLVVASYDPVAIDAYGASLLGKDWRDIGHIRMADGIIGSADFSTLVEPSGA